MRSRRSSGVVKFVLAVSLLGNLGLAAWWFWPQIKSLPGATAAFLNNRATPDEHAGAPGVADDTPGRRSAPATPAPDKPPVRQAGPSVTSPDKSTVRIRLDGGRHGYCLKIRGLDAKPEAAPAPDDLAAAADLRVSALGPPPGTSRDILSLPAGEVAGGPYVQVVQRILPVDETAPAAPASLQRGCCRLQFTLEYGKGSSKAVAFAAVSGTYHDGFETAAQKWEGDRLPLWRYHSADGHGNQFAYEVFLEKRAGGE